MLRYSDDTPVKPSHLADLVGVERKKETFRSHLVKAGLQDATLAEQIRYLQDYAEPEERTGEDYDSLSRTEALRLKTIREVQLLESRGALTKIEADKTRGEVVELSVILDAWQTMVVSVRESLAGLIPTLVDKILPLDDRDEALERAEDALSTQLQRVSQFDLERELTDDKEEYMNVSID